MTDLSDITIQIEAILRRLERLEQICKLISDQPMPDNPQPKLCKHYNTFIALDDCPHCIIEAKDQIIYELTVKLNRANEDIRKLREAI